MGELTDSTNIAQVSGLFPVVWALGTTTGYGIPPPQRLRKCLGDGRLPGPGEAVQPEDALALLAVQPTFNLPEDLVLRSLQAPLPFPTEITRILGMTHPLKSINIC